MRFNSTWQLKYNYSKKLICRRILAITLGALACLPIHNHYSNFNGSSFNLFNNLTCVYFIINYFSNIKYSNSKYLNSRYLIYYSRRIFVTMIYYCRSWSSNYWLFLIFIIPHFLTFFLYKINLIVFFFYSVLYCLFVFG